MPRLLRDTARRIFRFTDGRAVTTDSVADAECGCCGPGCEDGRCPNGSPVVRVACDHQFQYALSLAIEATLRATRVQPRTQDKLESQLPTFGVADGSGPGETYRGYPTVTDLDFELIVTPPTPTPGPANAARGILGSDYAWAGYYKRLGVNGNSYEFDASEGVGVAVTATASDGHTLGYPTYEAYAGGGSPYYVADYTLGDGEPVAFEEFVLEPQIITGPSISAGTGGFDATVSLTGSLLRHRTMGASVTSPGESSSYFQWYTEGHRLGAFGYDRRVAVGLNTRYDPESRDPAPPVLGLCSGTAQSGVLVATYQTFPNDGTEDKGAWTMSLVNPDDAGISEAEYGIRNCPCALHVTGTLYVPVWNTTGTPAIVYDSEGVPIGSPVSHYGVGIVDLRLVRGDPPGCNGAPLALWQGNGESPYENSGAKAGTITFGTDEFDVLGVTLQRLGPKHYRMRGSVLVPVPPPEQNPSGFIGRRVYLFDLRLKLDGLCPSDVVTCEQFAQPHTWWGRTTEGGPRVLIDELANGTGIHPTSSVDLPVLLPDVAGDDIAWLTANALTIESSDPIEGDPPCGLCTSEPCENCPDAPDAAAVVAPCDDLPAIVIDKTGSEPCAYSGEQQAEIDDCEGAIEAIGGNDHITVTVDSYTAPPDYDDSEGPYTPSAWVIPGTSYTFPFVDGPPRYQINGLGYVSICLYYPGAQIFLFNAFDDYVLLLDAWEDLIGTHVVTAPSGATVTVTIAGSGPGPKTYTATIAVEETGGVKEYVLRYGCVADGWTIIARRPCADGPIGDYAVSDIDGDAPCSPTVLVVAE